MQSTVNVFVRMLLSPDRQSRMASTLAAGRRRTARRAAAASTRATFGGATGNVRSHRPPAPLYGNVNPVTRSETSAVNGPASVSARARAPARRRTVVRRDAASVLARGEPAWRRSARRRRLPEAARYGAHAEEEARRTALVKGPAPSRRRSQGSTRPTIRDEREGTFPGTFGLAMASMAAAPRTISAPPATTQNQSPMLSQPIATPATMIPKSTATNSRTYCPIISASRFLCSVPERGGNQLVGRVVAKQASCPQPRRLRQRISGLTRGVLPHPSRAWGKSG